MARIIDVVSHASVADDELVWREPQEGNGDLRMGSQCIVQESQAAVFVRQGQALDVLGPGSHTLSTGNIPILAGVGAPTRRSRWIRRAAVPALHY